MHHCLNCRFGKYSTADVLCGCLQTPLALTISASLRAYAAVAAAAAAVVAPVVLRHLDVRRQLVQPRISAALPQVEEDDASVPGKHRKQGADRNH
jgi:hypothetical protein